MRRVLVLNKSDLPERLEPEAIEADGFAAKVQLSARTHAGLDELRGVLSRMLESTEGEAAAEVVLANERQFAAVSAAAQSLEQLAAGLSEGVSLDLLTVDAQEAIERLAEVTGSITGEDVLDRIFSRFCIGK